MRVFSLFCPFVVILTMNYHDFIWDLGGTYWIITKHKCLCSDIEGLSRKLIMILFMQH